MNAHSLQIEFDFVITALSKISENVIIKMHMLYSFNKSKGKSPKTLT